MSKVRIGLIGCGMIAQVMHLPHIAELDEQYELAAICDVSPGQLAATHARYPQARAYADYHDMLADPSVDAVMVLTRLHSEPAIAALRAGKHVFVEKPMCNSLREADEILEASAASGKHVMVGYHKRYDPGYLAGIEELATAEGIRLVRLHDVIGPNDVFLAHYDLKLHRDIPEAIAKETQAKAEAATRDAIGDAPLHVKRAYGLMLGLSTHDMTILRGAFGQAERVLSTEIWADGSYFTSVLQFGNDVRCVFDTGVVRHRIFDEELAVFAANKTVHINFPSPFIKNAPTTVDVWELDGGRAVERRIIASYEEAFKRELVHFHDCIVNDREPHTNALEGRADTALLIEMVNVYLGR